MAGKKRTLAPADGVEDQVDTVIGKINSEFAKKSKEKPEEERVDGSDAPSLITGSIKPMERRKRRKASDKERHRNDAERPKAKDLIPAEGPNSDGPQQPPLSSSLSSGLLPEFHISVFRDLASADSSVREAAAEALVTELSEVQKVYENLGKKGADESGLQLEAEKDDGLNDCAPSLRYAIRRLIRGVSSSRECARQGFALGLTVVVGAIPSIRVESLMKLIVNLLEVSSSMKGQEARECLLGRLFAYGSLVRSERIAQEWVSNKNTPLVKEFINHVISLAAKKRYLQEPAVLVVLNLVEQLPADALLSHVLEAPGMHEWFEGAPEVGNPDALLLALKIREKISIDSMHLCKLLPYPFSPNKLFTADHMSSLVTCFKESTFCQPRVHSVWPVLINNLLPDMALQEDDAASGFNSVKKNKRSRKCGSSEEDIVKNLHCFCEVVIDGCLLQSSHDRKHLALDLLLLLLPKLLASCVEIVLSHKLVHCLMDILSTKDSWLYKVAHYFLKELSNCVSNDDNRRVAVIVALQKHSSGRFDCTTRTKTVKDLVADFKTGAGCMLFIQNLTNMFVDEGRAVDEPSDQSQTTDENSEMGSEDKDSTLTSGSPDLFRSWIIESLPRVSKQLKLDPDTKIRVQKEIMKFLAVQGLFSASLGTEVTSFELQEKFRWPRTAISSALCRMCVEQLQLLLSNVQKGEGLPSVMNGPESNDLGSYFMRFLGTLCSIPSVSLFRTLSNEDDIAFKKLQEMEIRLFQKERNSEPGNDANKLHALRYLLIQLLLQVLLRPGEFSEAASELIICCKKAYDTPDLINSLDEDDELDNGGTPPVLMDVLLDTLLSLLPQSSAPMRSAIEQVFRFFCNEVTDAGLLRMLRVIKKDLKPARHQVSDSEDDEDEDEDLLGIEEAEETYEAETAEMGDSDDEADDSEALGRMKDVNEDLPEASDDSDGGMDDDAMFRMDSYLAQIFKERKNQAGGETAQSQLALFKLRVLSLLEIYLHENPGKPQVLTVFSHLVQAFVNPRTAEGSEQLGQRIWGILQKKIFKAKEYPKGEHVQLSTLETLLEKNLKWASKPFKRKKSASNSSKKHSTSWDRHKMITSVAQNSTYWILKIVHSKELSDSELHRISNIFERILVRYFDSKKCQLKSEFVKEVFRRQPWIGQRIFHFLLDKCGSAKSEFRQVEALDLIDEILKSLVSGTADKGEKYLASRRLLKAHISALCKLMEKLLTNMPEKQSRRSDVRRFCGQVLQAVSGLNLKKPFHKSLTPDAYAACESQLGNAFLPFKSRD